MPYNFDSTPNRHKSFFPIKWKFYDGKVLPMWVADMDFSAPPAIQKALHKFVSHGDMGYHLPSPALFESITARMKKLYNWKISPEMIVEVPGVNSGYNVVARTFCTPRRGYLVQTPVYNEFLEAHAKTGAPQVVSPLKKKIAGNRISYEVDFDAFERAVKKVNMFLLCNPHNPIGKIYSRAELKRMAEICIAHDTLIVSDEIHSELLLDGNGFQPIASLGRKIADRTITLVSASKAYNVPGLLAAFAIIPNEEIRKRYKETVFKMGYHVAAAGLVAAQEAYSGQCDEWLKAMKAHLTGNRDFLVEYVSKYMPQAKLTVPSATYLAWLDCTELNLKPSPYKFFLKQANVALSDGAKFGKGTEQFVRLNFGTSHKLLKHGLDRMRKAMY